MKITISFIVQGGRGCCAARVGGSGLEGLEGWEYSKGLRLGLEGGANAGGQMGRAVHMSGGCVGVGDMGGEG